MLSRFGIVGVLVLLLGYCALTQFGGGGGGLIPTGQQTSAPTGKSTLDPNMRDFLTRVLGSTEEAWARALQPRRASATRRRGWSLIPAGTQTACGIGQAAMGPFYCPNDRSIYIDPGFFNELSQRFGAPGDFAMAYVIAHEVGHHVQNLDGTLEPGAAAAGPRRARPKAMRSRSGSSSRPTATPACGPPMPAMPRAIILEPGDVEEGMRAAEAIGDDTLQRQTQGTVVPKASPTAPRRSGCRRCAAA